MGDELIALLGIPGLGPKTVALLHREMKIQSLEDLKKAIADERITQLPGMGKKKIQNIVRGIELYAAGKERMPLDEALMTARETIACLKKATDITTIEAAGSLRRGKETIGVHRHSCHRKNKKEVIKAFVHLPLVHAVLAQGETKGSIVTKAGVQVDLRVVDKDAFGAALHYLTGSQAHNVHLRKLAKQEHLKINEYGIFLADKKIGGRRENDIYAALHMDWIPPELREDRGEIEAARTHSLPISLNARTSRGISMSTLPTVMAHIHCKKSPAKHRKWDTVTLP